MDSIPAEIALRLCEELREHNRGRWYTVTGLWCWGCVAFSQNDPARMCVNSRPDHRGCAQVNARYNRLTRIEHPRIRY